METLIIVTGEEQIRAADSNDRDLKGVSSIEGPKNVCSTRKTLDLTIAKK